MRLRNSTALATVVLATCQLSAQGVKEARLPQLGYLSDGMGRADTAMSPDEAARAEQQLESNPEDLDTRAKLLKFYWYAGLRAPRLDSIFWLIEHHPEADLHENETARMFPVKPGDPPRSWFPGDRPLNDADDYAHAYVLWRQQIDSHPNEAAVLFNAARFLGVDARGGIQLAEDAQRIDPVRYTTGLATRYSQILLGERTDPDMRARVASRLIASTDAKLIAATASEMLQTATQETIQGSKTTLPASAVQELAALIKRGQTLDRENRQWSEMLQGVNDLARENTSLASSDSNPSVKPPRILAGRGVVAGNLSYAPPPVYPADAKAAGIQGTVKLTVLIAPDGHVRDIKVDNGPAELLDAARSAVAQYIYKPSMVDGRPAEVITTVEVAFHPE